MTDDPEVTDPRDPYKRRDIVAELDAWIAYGGIMRIDPHQAQRVRDEIVALREKVFIFAASNEEEKINIRDAALEEAAQVCIRLVRGFPQCGIAASAIRKLKDGPKCP